MAPLALNAVYRTGSFGGYAETEAGPVSLLHSACSGLNRLSREQGGSGICRDRRRNLAADPLPIAQRK